MSVHSFYHPIYRLALLIPLEETVPATVGTAQVVSLPSWPKHIRPI